MEDVSLADIKDETSKLEDVKEDEKEKETPPEAPAEKKPEDKKEEETEEEKEAREAKEKEAEEKLPFHKHPRFKALVEEKNLYKKELDELKEDVESKFSAIKESQSKDANIPGWFSELYGENETAWKKYQEHDKQIRDEIKEEIREGLEKEQKEKEESVNKWSEWIDDQVKDLKDEGLKFDRNELMKVMFDYKPADEKGNLDFHKGYEILGLLKKKSPERIDERKKLIDDSGKGKIEPETKKWKTPEDLVGVGW